MIRHANRGFPRRWRGRRALLFCTALLVAGAAAAEPGPVPGQPNTEALEESFRGITANGEPVYGLFPIEATGVAATPVFAAADGFLDALDEEQRKRARFAVDDPAWRNWDPHGDDASRGVALAGMGEAARAAAFELLEASLSARGLELVQALMKAGNGGGQSGGDRPYRIAIMGEPSKSEPWGWQLRGRDLVINYFVLGDQVVMAPVFLGSDAASAGRSAALQEHQDRGAAMLESLGAAQRQMARIEAEEGGGIVAGARSDNAVVRNVGIPASLMDEAQRSRLLELIELYVGNLREGHAAVKMREVETHIGDTYFAWIGGSENGTPSYYRIFSPVILIEFERQALAAGGAEHLHAVVRTPNGNDYGRALLARHRAERLGGRGD